MNLYFFVLMQRYSEKPPIPNNPSDFSSTTRDTPWFLRQNQRMPSISVANTYKNFFLVFTESTLVDEVGDSEHDNHKHDCGSKNNHEGYCIGIGPALGIIDEEIYHNHRSRGDRFLSHRETEVSGFRFLIIPKYLSQWLKQRARAEEKKSLQAFCRLSFWISIFET